MQNDTLQCLVASILRRSQISYLLYTAAFAPTIRQQDFTPKALLSSPLASTPDSSLSSLKYKHVSAIP